MCFVWCLFAMFRFGSVIIEKLGVKLTSMGCDGSSVLQGAWASVTTQMKDNVAPFMIGMHCFAHWTNLIVLVLSKFNLVAHFETLFQVSYVFFSHPPKTFGIPKVVWCAHNQRKKIVEKCEDKMDQHVVSSETCDGAILSFDYKDAWWCIM